MTIKKLLFLAALFFILCPVIFAYPIYSPSWGFSLDMPEGYLYSGGDGKDRFSFENADEAKFDIVVYHAEAGKSAPYSGVEALARDVQARLNNKGGMEYFEYRQKKAYVLELSFSVSGSEPRLGRSYPMEGWALCIELGFTGPEQDTRPLLLAMAYGPAAKTDLLPLHFSVLDSLAPEESDKLAPGPITEFSYPRENLIHSPVFGLGINAMIYREDAEAAQALIDREFQVMRRYVNAPNWREAWIRFYRAIYRDSFDRLTDIAFQVERKLNVPARENRDFADQLLKWVQSFKYERHFEGSDFQNLVTAAVEGRGDCDSRAMLWAVILKHSCIPSAIMVSRNYSHAMGLADLPGPGARFEVEGQKLLVAETTANVSIGLIGETVSEIEHWLGVLFE